MWGLPWQGFPPAWCQASEGWVSSRCDPEYETWFQSLGYQPAGETRSLVLPHYQHVTEKYAACSEVGLDNKVSQSMDQLHGTVCHQLVTWPVGECLQAVTEDAPVLDRTAPLICLHDSGAGYKYPDLRTYCSIAECASMGLW